MGIENFSGVSWRNAPFCANQKLLIKLTFQCGNLLAERWLCDMQYFSSLGQATNIYNFYEVFQASEVLRVGPSAAITYNQNARCLPVLFWH